MNMISPCAGLETNATAISALITLLKDGFENPYALRGMVRIAVPECPEQSFLVNLGKTLETAPAMRASLPTPRSPSRRQPCTVSCTSLTGSIGAIQP